MLNTARRSRMFRSQAGSSLAEVMVTIGIVASVMGMGVLGLERGYLNLTTTKQEIINDLRRARMQATLKGAHFRFEAMGNKYSVTRLADSNGDGTWDVDPAFPAKIVDLPSGFSVVVSSAGASAAAEFDGRGLLVPPATGSFGIISVLISDSKGKSETVQIWPSGQVEEASGADAHTVYSRVSPN